MILHNDNVPGNTEEDIKRRCISLILYVVSVALCLYSIIIYVTFKDKNFALVTFIYSLVLLCTFFLVRKTFNIKVIVHLYLIFDPLFAAFIMLYFWRYSSGTALWILPVPIGAYMFLEKKYIYIYTLYVLLIMLFITFISEILAGEIPGFNNTDVSDALVGTASIIIVILLLYYNDKIKSVRIADNFGQDRNSNDVAKFKSEITNRNDKSKTLKETLSGYDRDKEKYAEIFQNVQNIVEGQLSFKDTYFTISQLSHLTKINNLYIAKSIKLNGYYSFSHYINFCRIEYVKKLIDENDLSKITLMCIYTSSGFNSQSTFNRVFKQIEGVTPTEYIYNIK
ncbi:helix-turn-helix domain-containing protein [Chryseobacterium sp. RP-3-3]|uniref:Helix-turn-helix domain-containing protein n=1 Tax=Chryseobacterium antibioticum TaxID=2728847 RepID=A0A7Y0FQJ3_9FLAO|nr:helix-turn-helix domain-containing protein [Chryseobacterium antibioticum]NML68715.1 helix-turn-helix domain-containing protein [Chryseobacterium antibioticum]